MVEKNCHSVSSVFSGSDQDFIYNSAADALMYLMILIKTEVHFRDDKKSKIYL